MDEIEIVSRNDEESPESSKDVNDIPARHRISISRKLRQSLTSGMVVTDISSGSFRYVYLIKKGGKITVMDFGDFTREDLGLESDDPQDIYRAGLVRVEGNAGVNAGDILVVTSQLDFFIRKLDLPLSKRSEIERAAKWEFGKRIPLEIEDSYLKLRRHRKHDGICSLTAGAVPKNQVDYWHFLEERLIGVVPTTVALVPAGPPAISRDLTYCYIFYDEMRLCIGFYSQGGLLYHHPIIEESSIAVFETGDPFFDRSKIVDELASSMEVFYSRFPDHRVAGIVLFASPEEVSRLAPLINEEIVIDVLPADITEYVKIDESCADRDLGPEYFPLLGAARVVKDDFIFLPKTLEDNIKIRLIRKAIYYGLSAGLLTLLLLIIFLMAGINLNKSRLKNLVDQKTHIETSTAFQKSREYAGRTSSMTALNNMFEINDENISQLYESFATLTPNNIYLNNLGLVRQGSILKIEISGYFEGKVSEADVAILAFMDNLKNSGISDIRLRRLGQKLSGNIKNESFAIDGRYDVK
jgi:hypothetical protein